MRLKTVVRSLSYWSRCPRLRGEQKERVWVTSDRNEGDVKDLTRLVQWLIKKERIIF